MSKKGKILQLAASALAASVVAFSATGCSLFMENDGSYPSPYEIATQTGYVGSEGAYLASLTQGESTFFRSAYSEAQKEGYTGTFLDFLKEYCTVSVDDSAAVNRAAMSSVSIYCNFTQKTSTRPYGYSTTVQKAGSGVIYSLDKEAGNAYIVTNYHVVYDSESTGNETVAHISDDITVYLYGAEIGTSAIKATYLGGALDYDIAVLKVENSETLKKSDAKVAIGGNSDAVSIGERTYIIGNSNGEGISVTQGVVSVTNEQIEVSVGEDGTVQRIWEIRTDAQVNAGNSGGGMFNADGKLIGIAEARADESGVYGMCYAIPSNLALSVAQNIIDNQSGNFHGATKAYLGIVVQTTASKAVFDENTQKSYIEETIVVQSTDSSGIAASVLQAGDVLYSVTLNGTEYVITNQQILTSVLFRVRKGDTLTLKVYRNNELKSFDLLFSENSFFKIYS